jgi:hydrogenase maturation protease
MISEEQLRGGADAPPRKVLLLGVGNILLGDDGFGVHLINSLADTPLPPNVQVLEAGTVSHQLIPLIRALDNLIVIDVVDAGDTPGSIFRFSPEDLKFAKEDMVSLHQISLIDVLTMAEMTGGRPKTVIIAVQPKDVTNWSLELTEPVKAVMPKVKELIFEELKKMGVL